LRKPPRRRSASATASIRGSTSAMSSARIPVVGVKAEAPCAGLDDGPLLAGLPPDPLGFGQNHPRSSGLPEPDSQPRPGSRSMRPHGERYRKQYGVASRNPAHVTASA
jgi:hypothetical protein